MPSGPPAPCRATGVLLLAGVELSGLLRPISVVFRIRAASTRDPCGFALCRAQESCGRLL